MNSIPEKQQSIKITVLSVYMGEYKTGKSTCKQGICRDSLSNPSVFFHSARQDPTSMKKRAYFYRSNINILNAKHICFHVEIRVFYPAKYYILIFFFAA